MTVQPYLYLAGRSEEAIAFYETAIGARRGMVMRFSESPEPTPEGMIAADWGDRVMHAEIEVSGGRIMLSDGCGPQAAPLSGFSITVTFKTVDEVDRAYAALSAGGQITMPIGKTFFAERFGMLIDQFGVPWTLISEGEAA